MNFEEINKFLEINDTQTNNLLKSFLQKFNINDKIIVSDSIYTDTKIDEWITKFPHTLGGSILINNIIKNPIHNKKLLLERQKTNIIIPNYQLKILKEKEKDLLWIMTLKEEIDDDYFMKILFPSTYIINYVNNYRLFLDFYHFYKIIINPATCLIYPLSIIITPFYYLNKQMRLNMKFIDYIKILSKFIKILLKPSGNLRKDLIKIISFFIYVFIYLYSIYQTFLISYIIYKTRNKLLKKLEGLYDFIKTALLIIKKNKDKWKPFYIYEDTMDEIDKSIHNLNKIGYDLSSIYKLWKNKQFKIDIIRILKVIYTIDVIHIISQLKRNKYWTLPSFNQSSTKIWNIHNPLLNEKQIANPVNLDKNLIITGVNAGGKTTYVKSIASNIILAQTIGIINAIRGDMMIYDSIVSFMRISDEVGSKSYFEAETSYCSKMIEIAEDVKNRGGNGLFILDEPMHSTPYFEGVSVAYSIAKYMGELAGIRIIITTHFHKLIELGNIYPEKFLNLSVNALKINDKYEFDYKIRNGGSKQSIAIELLKRQELNDVIINSAIEMKNKICNEDVRQ
jgi:hypothetical protein